MKILVIILTYNEELHIARCIASAREVSDHVWVVDSLSTDGTVEIARKAGAMVLQRAWTYHADQFNWALAQISETFDWIVRIDADEVCDARLVQSIRQELPALPADVAGASVRRQLVFQGTLIRFGGFTHRVTRIFRPGRGRYENRVMDEHLVVDGRTVPLTGAVVDENLNSLTWWIAKHNEYASKEAFEVLKFRYFPEVGGHLIQSEVGPAQLKRRLKEFAYRLLPGSLSAILFFLYRYIVRLGFLDGAAGFDFHFLQGLWFRLLVNTKVREAELRIRRDGRPPREVAEQLLARLART